MILTEALVERGEHLQALEDAVSDSIHAGRVVLLGGESGFGKTSLVQALRRRLDHRHRVLVAACEPVGIPAPFAPLFDVADELPEDIFDLIRSSPPRPEVYAAILRLLKRDHHVFVLEDMHWADEATLGLARYLGRRIAGTSSCLVLSYRTEEVDMAHPLRLVMADLRRGAVRIELPPLTVSGVEEMAAGIDVDARAVHAATLGNPFFVDQLLRQPDAALPPSVEDAILASVAQLPREAREALYLVAVSPDGVSPGVLLELTSASEAMVDASVQRKLLVVSSQGDLVCRHDLIRQALLHSVPPALERRLHARLLAVHERTGEGVEIEKLAYHSVGAGGAAKAATYSRRAARASAAVDAHRQAAFHYDNVVRFEAAVDPETLDQVLLAAAHEHCLINEFDAACTLAQRRVQLAKGPRQVARAAAWYSYFLSRENDLAESRKQAEDALEELTDANVAERALALAVIAWVEMVEGNRERAIEVGDEAVVVARRAGARDVELHAAVTAGTSKAMLRLPSGVAQLDEAVHLGLALAPGEQTARALNNRGVVDLHRGQLGAARDWFDRLIEYTAAHELDAWYIAGVATRAWIDVASGRWEDADRGLEIVLGQKTCTQTEVESLVAAATLRARRGDPGAGEIVGDALGRIEGTTDHESRVMGCALALEAAWMGMWPLQDAVGRYRELLGSPYLAEDPSGRGVLGYWARRLDLDPPGDPIPGPAGLEWKGDVDGAANSWRRKGLVVHAAVTRAFCPDTDLAAVFAELQALGAVGVVRGLRGELQRQGVQRVPRGERPSTRRHPAGLTLRQAEVLALMAAGMSNAAIAEHLYISEKTASHHVSAVLTKLNVSSRLEAVALAHANGWAGASQVAN